MQKAHCTGQFTLRFSRLCWWRYGSMRTYRNLKKGENEQLSRSFSYLLKENEDCTPEECSWVAVTVFDHWLHEDDSYHLINDATEEQKRKWNQSIFSFLGALVKVEEPLRYKYLGRYPNKRLQFSQYIGATPIEIHVVELFKTVYEPYMAFPNHGFHVRFEDDWTIYIVYQNVDSLVPVYELVEKTGLYLLPVSSAEHLNQYAALAETVSQKGLIKALHRTSR